MRFLLPIIGVLPLLAAITVHREQQRAREIEQHHNIADDYAGLVQKGK